MAKAKFKPRSPWKQKIHDPIQHTTRPKTYTHQSLYTTRLKTSKRYNGKTEQWEGLHLAVEVHGGTPKEREEMAARLLTFLMTEYPYQEPEETTK